MTPSTVVIQPITDEDMVVLRKRSQNSWFTFLRLYVPLFLFLVYIYYRMQPGGVFRGHYLSYGKLTHVGFSLLFLIFATFFGGLFLGFSVRDYRSLIRPFQHEL